MLTRLIDWLLDPIEYYLRRRKAARDTMTDERLPEALQAFRLFEVVPMHGYYWRVVLKRVQEDGTKPAIILEPIGPTRRRVINRLKGHRDKLRADKSFPKTRW